MKNCKTCGELKDFDLFYQQNKKKSDGTHYVYYNPECKECTSKRSLKWQYDNVEKQKEIKKRFRKTTTWRNIHRKGQKKYIENGSQKEWQQNNPEKVKVYNSNRRAFKELLPYSLTVHELKDLEMKFNRRCCLTESEDYHLEHFIPHAWGHGGNYIGNVYFLSGSLNSTKKDQNPFSWIEREEVKEIIDADKWSELIKYLSSQNKMSIDEFRDFVNWCETNRRTIDDLQQDNSSSVELWRTKHTS